MSKVYRHSDGSYNDYPQGSYNVEVPIANSDPEPLLNSINVKVNGQNGKVLPDGSVLFEKEQTGSKNDSGKPRMELIPAEFTIEVAKALTFGANKYADDNFRKGISYKRLLGAAKRHIEQELAGIETDNESGLSHLAHAGASLAMYSFMKTHRPDLDDRYKYTEEQKKKLEEMMYGVKK